MTSGWNSAADRSASSPAYAVTASQPLYRAAVATRSAIGRSWSARRSRTFSTRSCYATKFPVPAPSTCRTPIDR